MAINNLQDAFFVLQRWGLSDAILPFLLVFSVFFAILQKTKLFGEHSKNVNVTVALVMGLLFIVPHVINAYPSGYDVVEILNRALPATSIVVIAIVMFLILIGLFGADTNKAGMPIGTWVMIVALLLIIFIFGASAGWWAQDINYWFTDFFSDEAVIIVILILVFGVIISFVTGEEGKKSEYSEDIKKLFGGGGGSHGGGGHGH